MSSRNPFPLLVAGLALATATAADAALVVRSVGNGVAAYPVGKIVSPETPIRLGPGDMITVLDGRVTRTFRGPGIVDLSRAPQATSSLAAAGAAFDARSSMRKPRLGTVRGIPAIDAGSLWDVDLDSTPETQCVIDPMNVNLRRSNAEDQRTLTIAPARGQSLSLTIPAGKASAAWPKEVPASGAFTLSDGKMKRTVRFQKIPSPTGDPATDADALIKAGCTQQLEKYVATLEQPAS